MNFWYKKVNPKSMYSVWVQTSHFCCIKLLFFDIFSSLFSDVAYVLRRVDEPR